MSDELLKAAQHLLRVIDDEEDGKGMSMDMHDAIANLRSWAGHTTTQNEYAFDVSLIGAVRVKAHSISEAIQKIRRHVNCVDVNHSASRDVKITEVSVSDPELDHDCIFEINGKEMRRG